MAQVIPFNLGDSNFDPETIETLSAAFEEAWRKTGTSNSRYTQPAYAAAAREVVAKHIIGLAKSGERDPVKLCDSAVEFLASSPYESKATPRDYRFVARSKRNHIVGPPEIVTCKSDQEAIEQATHVLGPCDIEIWQGPRIVIRLAAIEE